MPSPPLLNRDISWLTFNERVLREATRDVVPLMERLRFLSIFSSNLDEFYRVRMPVLQALHQLKKHKKKTGKNLLKDKDVHGEVNQTIIHQSKFFGSILVDTIIPRFRDHGIHMIYNEQLPVEILAAVNDYFFEHIAGFIEIVFIHDAADFFPENNKLYISVLLDDEEGKERIAWVNIPSDAIPRFFTTILNDQLFIVFIDDIIKAHLPLLFPKSEVKGAYSVKITRDADLHLLDEFEGDIADKIEKQLGKRDFGMATRFLYSPGFPTHMMHIVAERFSLYLASLIEGGEYHNLSDFAGLPVNIPALFYPQLAIIHRHIVPQQSNLFDEIAKKDILIHTPFQGYSSVLRFFNEAAIGVEVEEIYVTLYRIANDSRIAHALISAAKNGKKVTVFVEVKARFDELNNIRWAKKMKAAGVHIIYSIPELKVHAKVALLQLRKKGKPFYLGLFATGNLNEITAGFYTDHILLTANHAMLAELETLFHFLEERKKPKETGDLVFKQLLIAQFNLRHHFLNLLDNEIVNARKGLPSGITIKLNNLEEEVLITKLYEAGSAGVKIHLIVRGICRLIPSIKGPGENISVTRIVGRFLEHGRVFIFCNGGDELVYLGSSDWMYRNIYARIEVCFPVHDDLLKKEITDIIKLQLQDNISAAVSNEITPGTSYKEVESQQHIYEYLQKATISNT